MSLVDLKSDLSKYRAQVSNEEKNTPEASSATGNKNFATAQPITDSLINKIPDIKKPAPKKLIDSLRKTKLDDIKKSPTNTGLIGKLNSTNLDDIKKIKNDIKLEDRLDSTNLDDIVKSKSMSLEDRYNSSGVESKPPTKNKLPLEERQISTEVDDKRNPESLDLLINSVSIYSPQNTEILRTGLNNVPLEQIASKFSNIQIEKFVSKLNNSNIEIVKTVIGENNNKSNITPNQLLVSSLEEYKTPNKSPNSGNTSNNVVNPETKINKTNLTYDRNIESPEINTDTVSSTDNIINPNIKINSVPLSFEKNSNFIIINKELFSPINNIIDPEIALQKKELTFDRAASTPNIITDTIKEGLVVNPNTKVLRLESNTDKLKDISELNLDGKPIKFVASSRVTVPKSTILAGKRNYNTSTKYDQEESQLSLMRLAPQRLSGRNDIASKSLFSTKGVQSVNMFSDIHVDGFVSNAQLMVTNYDTPGKRKSLYGWTGGIKSSPSVNFMSDFNAEGFLKFAKIGDTKFNTDSSQLTFKKLTPVNFFDIANQYTNTGFQIFTERLSSAFVLDSSTYGWIGNREQAPTVDFLDWTRANTIEGFGKLPIRLDSKYIPESSDYTWKGGYANPPAVNFFDTIKDFTKKGFSTFHELFDSKYKKDASRFDWDGTRRNASTVNYFDLENTHTTDGFHSFSRRLETMYVEDASTFDWDGNKTDAPGVNFFDSSNRFTTAGFSTFHQNLDTKYIDGASTFDWNGQPKDAPAVNYFDLNKQYTTDGFHRLAIQQEPTKYKPNSSIFDWDGLPKDAPAVNYFDLTNKFTEVGFHNFAKKYESKYIEESSEFDWDGTTDNSPEVNFFDITGKFTKKGFHRKALQQEPTKYVPESSRFDWDGTRPKAPEVNFFDLSGQFTTSGFHRLAIQQEPTKYKSESSRFDWDGGRGSSPEVNFFDLGGQFTAQGFHRLAKTKEESKYVPESSEFDWDGVGSSAPEVNFFDITGKFTTSGFHRLAQTKEESKYVPESSEFDWDGKGPSAPEVNFFDITGKFTTRGFHRLAKTKEESKYIPESSEFDWNGKRNSAPAINFFDISGQYTTSGFHVLAIQQEPTKYIPESSRFDWDGKRIDSPEVNFFDITNRFTTSGFHRLAETSEESKYVPESSTFDWTGTRQNAPEVNFFDITKQFTKQGFHTLAQQQESTSYRSESSTFDWAGTRQTAPEVNFFDKENKFTKKGFHSLADQSELTVNSDLSRYLKDSSRFDWNGSRVKAPTTKYFTAIGQSILSNALGFTKFFIDKGQTKLNSRYSSYSTETGSPKSAVIDIPTTDFFGFIPSERRGFLTNMNVSDGTLYPIVSPVLKYTNTAQERLGIQLSRSSGTTTRDGEKFAPLSLGKRPWADGTLASTLENQIPNIKTGAKPGSYSETYETNLKQSTNTQGEVFGHLRKWAVNNGKLDEQYDKFYLVDSAWNLEAGDKREPFVTRGIQTKGRKNPQRWGSGADTLFGFLRASTGVVEDRGNRDFERVSKWLTTIKGKSWEDRQSKLYAMNPIVDFDPNQSSTSVDGKPINQFYNKLSLTQTIQNTSISRALKRISRHGSDHTEDTENSLNKYEISTLSREKTDISAYTGLATPTSSDKTNYNRLVGLMKELLPNAFNTLTKDSSDNRNVSILRISSENGGPGSALGDGGTIINRATHPYLGVYTTSPIFLKDGDLNPSTMKVNIFYGALTDKKYHDVLSKQAASDGKYFGILNSLVYILNGAKYENDTASSAGADGYVQTDRLEFLKKAKVFEPRYDSIADRVKARTKDMADRNGKLLSDGNYDENAEKIKQYMTLNYNKLQKVKRGESGRSRSFNDFRHDLVDPKKAAYFSSDPKVARYHTNNIEDKHGFGKHGQQENQKNLPFLSNVSYKNSGNRSVPVLKTVGGGSAKFRGDRINIIDFKKHTSGLINSDAVYETGAYNNPNIPGAHDLIEFYFSSLNIIGTAQKPAEIIVFRASFDTITDNHKPSWSPIKYMGRGDPIYMYDGYERDVSFGFTIHIGSRDEMKATWRKLNFLAGYTAPEYASGFMKAPLCRLNIGNLFKKMPGFISSLSYSFDNVNGYWETAQLPEDKLAQGADISAPGALQLPKIIQVSVGFTPVGVYRPEKGGTFYSLYDDSSANNGLLPRSGDKVSYFRTYDDVGPLDAANVAQLSDAVLADVDPSKSSQNAAAPPILPSAGSTLPPAITSEFGPPPPEIVIVDPSSPPPPTTPP